MKERFFTIGMAVIPSALLTIFFELTTKISIKYKALFLFIVFICTFLFLEVGIFIWEGNLKAKFDLWRNGKIKGIWEKKGLIKQLEKSFNDSDYIRVKVTRGYELFQRDEKYGFVKFFDKLKKENVRVNIRFLLIVPCFKVKHVQERFERHNGMTKEEFLETWYKSMLMMKEYSDEKLSLNVRFYLGGHARWRFYIFSKGKGAKVRVFLSDYDKDTSGSEQPMYKIIKKDPNIASFMTTYFDELWDTALTPLELYKKIEKDECMRYFCGNCEQKEKCGDCPHGSCEHKKQCKAMIKQYENELKGFSVR